MLSLALLFFLASAILWMIESKRDLEDVETLLETNFRDIDTSLTDGADHQLLTTAKKLAGELRRSGRRSNDELRSMLADLEVSLICDIDSNGIVIACNDPSIVGFDMNSTKQSREFIDRLAQSDSYVQTDMPRGADGALHKFAGAVYPEGKGFIQVAWNEKLLESHIRDRVYWITRSWHIDESGYIIMVDPYGKIICHSDSSLIGKSLIEVTGLDPQKLPRNKYFRTMVNGEDVCCHAGDVRGYLGILLDPAKDAFASRNRTIPVMIMMEFLIFIGLYLLLTLLLKKLVTNDLSKVGGALEQIAAGNLEQTVNVRTSREFSDLSDNINTTVASLRKAAEEESRRLLAELELGRTIQMAALPAEFPNSPYFRLCAAMTTAREVGGDFYDFFSVDENRLAFLVADVSGKGITAALYMMTAKTLIKDTLINERDPATALTKANAELCRNNPANMFLTAWVGVLDIETGRMTFANAGHNPPLIRRADGSVSFIHERSGCMLAFIDQVTYRSYRYAFSPGDTLFLYTDGVTEAMNHSQELFGEDRLESTIRNERSADPLSLCNAVRTAVDTFAAGAPPSDDLTVLSIQCLSLLKRFVRTFPPTKEALKDATAFLNQVLESGNCPPAIQASMDIVLDEIASNIVSYSQASGFELDIELVQGGVKLAFIDDGTPYNPLTHEDPDTTLSAEERPIGGLGIMMVKKIADSVTYNRAHNRNFLIVSKSFG
ncbi:MAG: SpoIIE family protein phosphatase [Kiritimatiellae bacterium]|nr:SpoIIE family protein phosphatase [Kiritimatiellia bacterium]